MERREFFSVFSAEIIGDVRIGEDSGVWYHATVRGDKAPVRIGRRSNVQDNAVIHVSEGHPTIVGDGVTIGHGAIVHGCTVGDNVLVGMGAIILDGAKIGNDTIIAAGALVTQGKEIPPRSLVIGTPGKVVRQLTREEIKSIKDNAQEYVDLIIETKAK